MSSAERQVTIICQQLITRVTVARDPVHSTSTLSLHTLHKYMIERRLHEPMSYGAQLAAEI